MRRTHTRWLLLPLLVAEPVLADAVPPPPARCPPGYRRAVDHGGPYCEPPQPWCRKGQVPRVKRTQAYCERPPTKPCPAGSYWYSSGPELDNGLCYPGIECHLADDEPGRVCVEAALCIRELPGVRGSRYQIVVGACPSNTDCASPDRCVHASWSVTKDQLTASGGPPPPPPAATSIAVDQPAPPAANAPVEPPPTTAGSAEPEPAQSASVPSPPRSVPPATGDVHTQPTPAAVRPHGCGCILGESATAHLGWTLYLVSVAIGLAVWRKKSRRQ